MHVTRFRSARQHYAHFAQELCLVHKCPWREGHCLHSNDEREGLMKSFRTPIRLLIGALLLFAAQPMWAATITGSQHDFTSKNWSGGRICIACHVAHKSDTSVTDAPLWSHVNSTQTYTLYSSPTMNAGTMSQPSGLSKLCMSCHDGTVAVDSFGGVTGTTTITAVNNLGTTLADDHPIGFTYNTALATADGALFDPDHQDGDDRLGQPDQDRNDCITVALQRQARMLFLPRRAQHVYGRHESFGEVARSRKPDLPGLPQQIGRVPGKFSTVSRRGC